jgi:hypothetical protein
LYSFRLLLRTTADLDGRRTAASEKAVKRPHSHYSVTETSNSKLDTSFESYFGGGVERSASSDVVRIRVPYSRDDANSNNHKPSNQDENKIRISVNHESNGGAAGDADDAGGAARERDNRASLEDSFNTALVMSKKHTNKTSKTTTKKSSSENTESTTTNTSKVQLHQWTVTEEDSVNKSVNNL